MEYIPYNEKTGEDGKVDYTNITKHYPLTLESTLPCYEGSGIIRIIKNGQQLYMAEGRMVDGEWDYIDSNQKFTFVLKPDPRNLILESDLKFEPELWNGMVQAGLISDREPTYFLTQQMNANCMAYAFNMMYDVQSGKDFERAGYYGMQPGQYGGRTKDESAKMFSVTNVLVNIIKRDCSALGLDFIPENEIYDRDTSGGYRVILKVRPENYDPKNPDSDYHWYRYDNTDNPDGYWSDKPGMYEAKRRTTDPTQHGYPETVGTFWILPQGDYNG